MKRASPNSNAASSERSEMQLAYHIVDVFTTEPFEGNALAVITDGSQLDTKTMQRIAREFNLSETAFIVPGASSGGGTRVRIFTPFAELEFAGHPTIGTAYVLRRLGIVPPEAPRFTLDENVGPVNVRVGEGDDPLLWLTTPPIRTVRSFAREDCTAAVGLAPDDLLGDVPCELLTAGNPTIFDPGAGSADRRSCRGRFRAVSCARAAGWCTGTRLRLHAGCKRRIFADCLPRISACPKIRRPEARPGRSRRSCWRISSRGAMTDRPSSANKVKRWGAAACCTS